ncbi:MAG TPA: hypothetical protein VK989_19760 [Polyangia bacterium]|jgi:hypothetical protein|nr:hypothetical protein [Polyangia bacterium]
MSASVETQERWRRFYEAAAEKSGDRDMAGEMIQKAQKRAIWQTLFMVVSTGFLCGMFVYFADILSR